MVLPRLAPRRCKPHEHCFAACFCLSCFGCCGLSTWLSSRLHCCGRTGSQTHQRRRGASGDRESTSAGRPGAGCAEDAFGNLERGPQRSLFVIYLAVNEVLFLVYLGYGAVGEATAGNVTKTTTVTFQDMFSQHPQANGGKTFPPLFIDVCVPTENNMGLGIANDTVQMFPDVCEKESPLKGMRKTNSSATMQMHMFKVTGTIGGRLMKAWYQCGRCKANLVAPVSGSNDVIDVSMLFNISGSSNYVYARIVGDLPADAPSNTTLDMVAGKTSKFIELVHSDNQCDDNATSKSIDRFPLQQLNLGLKVVQEVWRPLGSDVPLLNWFITQTAPPPRYTYSFQSNNNAYPVTDYRWNWANSLNRKGWETATKSTSAVNKTVFPCLKSAYFLPGTVTSSYAAGVPQKIDIRVISAIGADTNTLLRTEIKPEKSLLSLLTGTLTIVNTMVALLAFLFPTVMTKPRELRAAVRRGMLRNKHHGASAEDAEDAEAVDRMNLGLQEMRTDSGMMNTSMDPGVDGALSSPLLSSGGHA